MDNRPDSGIKKLKEINSKFSQFLENKGRTSESDTRVKLIDRILKEVLLWPESEISREDKVESGFTDYQLKIRKVATIALEAKKQGAAFTIPQDHSNKSYKLNGALMTDVDVNSAIKQVRQYCDDSGIRYAIATNGYTWIIFRAIRDNSPWREGKARVFPSSEYIQENFVEFWNLLSYEAICDGSLDEEFSNGLNSSRNLIRVIDNLYNSDLPLQRNKLNTQLQPIISYIFEDIASNNDPELLNFCYVHTDSLRVVASDLNVIITDAIPKMLSREGGTEISQGSDNAGIFEEQIEESILNRKGELYLLLGGIGSGKTTFLKRYQELLAKDLLQKNTYTFHLDFLGAPVSVERLESFVLNEILNRIQTTYQNDNLENFQFLKKVYKDKLKSLTFTSLRNLRQGSSEYEEQINKSLLRWQEDVVSYVPKLLKYASFSHGKSIVLFIDNVDQLDSDYQARIFLLSQRITRELGSITVIALREESYYTPNIQKTFTAYNSHKFHIASPQFKKMIESRIEYAIQAVEGNKVVIRDTILNGTTFNKVDICEFLKIVEKSVIQWKNKISMLIECVCFGNMRQALQMFTTFLTSGATDVNKMLLISQRDGDYIVAFHEFLKSIMLQDRAYYKEEQSPILNVFNCTSEKNSSHFTTLRILSMLLKRRGESNPEGEGYVELSRLVSHFEEKFDNVRDVILTLERLAKMQLIEFNTRSTTSVNTASHARVTSAGWYYTKLLCNQFAYLDLVLQDTPINDQLLANNLKQSVYEVNNLADREKDKQIRMKTRFDRTKSFLDYLSHEERVDFEKYNISNSSAELNVKFMPGIQKSFSTQRSYIERKIEEGRNVELPEDQIEEVKTLGEIVKKQDNEHTILSDQGN